MDNINIGLSRNLELIFVKVALIVSIYHFNAIFNFNTNIK